MNLFSGPIPGQSLTREPGNAPYERPPEIVDPEEALMTHLDRLTEPDRMEAILMLLEEDAPLDVVADNILRSAVNAGIHSIDVSLIIKKPIEEWIAGTAKEVGISFRTGYEDEEGKKARDRHAFLKALKGVSSDTMEISEADKKEALAETQGEQPMLDQQEQQQEPMMEDMPQEAPAAPSKGLMARG